MDDFARAAFREREAKKVIRRRAFWLHFAIWAATNVLLVVVWAVTGAGFPWFLFPLLGWGIGLVAHGVSAYLFADVDDVVLEREERRLRD
ncbi:MAG: 2TM domain-containing protein [Actinomycetota bacterium]|nr:2TM domain-containing protein [Actinomycetota bacterium]